MARQAGGSTDEASPPSKWRLGVGHAIDVLRKDVEGLFIGEPHALDTSIYSEDIKFADVRMPGFELNGLATYQRVLSTLQWSVYTACERSKFEITAISPPVNNEIYMRWRHKLWAKDVFAPAKGILALDTSNLFIDVPLTVEGCSKYEFDPWTAEIVRHTIDITNPPMYIGDLRQQHAPSFSWLTPVTPGMSVPSVLPHAPGSGPWTQPASRPLAGTTKATGAPRRERSSVSRAAGSWLPGLPESCDDDYECNGGKANFPMQCCELPLLGSFCCKPDDYEPATQNPALLPIPGSVDDPRQWEP